MNKIFNISILLATVIASLLITGLHAQENNIFELDPVIVRGDLLQSPIDEMPASVSVIRSTGATAEGSAHLENLLGRFPNLNWAGGTSRPRFFQIRGIGENSQFGNEIPSSSVGFIVDGIDLTGIGGVAGLFDVAQVEVLRGPQAAAFGANALAGMVLIETISPSSIQHGKAELTIGENDLFSFGVAVGGPIGVREGGTLSYRVSFHQNQDNGFRKNRFLNRDDTNERDEQTARIKLSWSPSSQFEVDLTLMYFNFENGYDAWSLTNDSFNTTTDEPGRDEQETIAAGVRATWHISESIDLGYIASISGSDLLYSYDWDWSHPDELMDLYGPEVYWGTDVTDRERTVSSHDLRVSSRKSEAKSNRATTWAAGVYYRNFEEDQAYFGVQSLYKTKTTALYGQARLPLTNDISLTLAARIEDVNINFSDAFGTSLGSSDQPWGGKIALEYRLSDDSMFYASLDHGFKAGGVNLDNDIPSESRIYGTEMLWNYELGWRGYLIDNSLHLQVTAFYMDRKDIQVDSSIQIGDGNTFALFKDNAASGNNYGMEIELDWRVDKQLRFFASLGLLDTRFDDYRYIDPSDGETEVVLDGHNQAYSPDFNYSIGMEYTWDNGFFTGLTLEGKDEYLFDVANNQTLSAYTLFHLHLGYDNGDWRFTLWGNNLLDELYETRGFFFANEPPYYDSPRKWVSHGAPRQIGFSVRYSF